MARFPYGFTLAVHRPPVPAEDRYGNPLPGTDHDVTDCAAAPAGSVEMVNGQATVIDRDTVYGPYDADVKPHDTVTIPAGQPIEPGDYQVDGTPARYKHPMNAWEAGCVIRLTRATG